MVKTDLTRPPIVRIVGQEVSNVYYETVMQRVRHGRERKVLVGYNEIRNVSSVIFTVSELKISMHVHVGSQ